MRKVLSLIAITSCFAVGSMSAQAFTVYDGTSHTHDFGVAGTVDNGVGNAAPSLHLALGGWQSSTFYAGGSTGNIAPEEIDWSAGDLTFEYMVPSSASASLFTVTLRVWNGSGHTSIATSSFGSGTSLIADDAWHTQTMPISDFTTDYYDAVTAGTIVPSAATDIRVTIQAHSAGMGDIYVDNIMVPTTVIPEPSTYAAIFGALAIGFVAWRRRRKS